MKHLLVSFTFFVYALVSFSSNSYVGNNISRPVENATPGLAHGSNATITQVFPDYLSRRYSSLEQRLGLISTINYKFETDNGISLFGTYLQLNITSYIDTF